MAHQVCLALFLVLKDFLYRHSEGTGNLEGESEGGHVFPLFQGNNGLPGTTNPAGQFLLRHLVMVETQPTNAIDYPGSSHRYPFLQ